MMTNRLWSEEEKEQLIRMYPNMYSNDIAIVMGKKVSSVYNQAFKLGIKKSKEFIAAELQIQAERLRVVGVAHRIKKGSTPPNKGKKMPKEVYEKCRQTMFKKGIVAPNAKYDGYERISKDGYIEIRVSPGKFMLKHRYVWEQANGPIPNGMLVVFRDRNHLNIEITNLELITRQENMQRNTVHRYPAELKAAIKLVHKLKRKINEKQD